ncbi:hypothetical protein PABG_11635 [Paracoccidioides brasiliensis Pb03]|nr:hypothetical protein PABG_11635 [Paracoccidioides brasiliensis Pb03]
MSLIFSTSSTVLQRVYETVVAVEGKGENIRVQVLRELHHHHSARCHLANPRTVNIIGFGALRLLLSLDEGDMDGHDRPATAGSGSMPGGAKMVESRVKEILNTEHFIILSGVEGRGGGGLRLINKVKVSYRLGLVKDKGLEYDKIHLPSRSIEMCVRYVCNVV